MEHAKVLATVSSIVIKVFSSSPLHQWVQFVWEREIKTETPASPALGPDGTIYLSSWQLAPGESKDHGRLAAYEPDSEGELKWSFKTAGSIFPPVVGGDGTVYHVTYQDESDRSKRQKPSLNQKNSYC